MTAKYLKGQKVVIKPVKAESLSPRDSDMTQYADQSGEVTDLYSISPSTSEVFYIYMVRVETDNRAIVLHEDEIQPYVS